MAGNEPDTSPQAVPLQLGLGPSSQALRGYHRPGPAPSTGHSYDLSQNAAAIPTGAQTQGHCPSVGTLGPRQAHVFSRVRGTAGGSLRRAWLEKWEKVPLGRVLGFPTLGSLSLAVPQGCSE